MGTSSAVRKLCSTRNPRKSGAPHRSEIDTTRHLTEVSVASAFWYPRVLRTSIQGLAAQLRDFTCATVFSERVPIPWSVAPGFHTMTGHGLDRPAPHDVSSSLEGAIAERVEQELKHCLDHAA
jgi:hypothetical protein